MCLVRKFCQSFLRNLYIKTLENIYKLLFSFGVFVGGFFVFKTPAKCQSGAVLDLFIHLKKKFSTLVEWFERFAVQHFYNLAAGCVKAHLNLALTCH